MSKIYNLIATSGEDETYTRETLRAFTSKEAAFAYREIHCDPHLPMIITVGGVNGIWWTSKDNEEEIWIIEETDLYITIDRLARL